jgi:hypothetical protein
MKALATLRRIRFSALLLTVALSLGALAASQPAAACGPYGPPLTLEERSVVRAAQGRLPTDGSVHVLSYGTVRIEEERAVVSLELYDIERQASFWRTFRFVRSDDGWRPAPRRRA